MTLIARVISYTVETSNASVLTDKTCFLCSVYLIWSLPVNKVAVDWKGFNPHLMITRGGLLLIEKLTQKATVQTKHFRAAGQIIVWKFPCQEVFGATFHDVRLCAGMNGRIKCWWKELPLVNRKILIHTHTHIYISSSYKSFIAATHGALAYHLF